jgi:hypothetical protein
VKGIGEKRPPATAGQVGEWVSLRTASKVKMGAVATSYEIKCEYSSVSGKKYISHTNVVNNQEISTFEFRVEPHPKI